MAEIDQMLMNGPIPGENLLSDPRQQPWKKEPQLKDMDLAIEYIMGKILEPKRARKFVTVMEMGVPIITLTDIFLTMGISKGKWTPDFAIALAGPTAHILKIVGDYYGIDYVIGLPDEEPTKSRSYYESVQNLRDLDPSQIEDTVRSEVMNPGMNPQPSTGMETPMAPESPQNMNTGFMQNIGGGM